MQKLVLILSLLFSLTATAQKVDLDRNWLRFNYTRLPDMPLPTDYRTYSFSIMSTSTVRYLYPDEQVKGMLMIEGWRQLEKKGHVNISISMQDIIIVSNTVQYRTEEIKDKDGKVTGKNYYYYPEVTYTWQATLGATDYKGTPVIRDYDYADRRSYIVWKGPEFSTNALANDYIYNNRMQIRDNLTQDNVTQTLKQFKNIINNRIGYRTWWENDELWILDNKKHPESDGQLAALAAAKDAIASLTATGGVEDAKVKFKPAIDYFNDLKKRITGTEKADKKLRYAAFYNLVKIYLYLDMPDEAIKEGEGLEQNDYDTKDGRRIKERAEELKKSFTINHTNTRHMAVDISGFAGPSN